MHENAPQCCQVNGNLRTVHTIGFLRSSRHVNSNAWIVTKGAANTMEKQGFQGTGEYVASEELMASVNIAIALKKPLLIKGEPGTGKTMLAEAVAKALGKRLIIWNIKSTTKAQEGLYVYDTIQRLYDGQFGEEGVEDRKSVV